MRVPRNGVASALLLLTTACSVIDLPNDFVRLRDGGEGLRAVTADDARLWVRDCVDPTDGTLEFWDETLRADFAQRGYVLVEMGETKDRAGVVGRWSEWRANERGEAVGYLLAAWRRDRWLASGTRLQVVEFAARAEVFRARVAAVREALATVR